MTTAARVVNNMLTVAIATCLAAAALCGVLAVTAGATILIHGG